MSDSKDNTLMYVLLGLSLFAVGTVVRDDSTLFGDAFVSGSEKLIKKLPPGKSPPANTAKWPKFPHKQGYEVVFMQWGPEGKGYYYVRQKPLYSTVTRRSRRKTYAL